MRKRFLTKYPIPLYFILFILSFFFLLHPPDTFSKPEKASFNVLLITIDTLRVDRLSCYGSDHLETPHIDILAKKGVLFTKAFSHTSTTLPSHTNILCGTTPPYHGVHDNFNFVLSEESLTLAEHLKSEGYSTGAFIGGFPLDSRFGLDQGFDVYDDDFGKKTEIEIRAEFVMDKALSWLKVQNAPWFLWIHCYDPHDPYLPPEPFHKQYEKDLYSGEVAYVDNVLGRLVDFLEKNNLYENTLIFFTGDHGEALGQHGEMTHSFFAYNEVIRIPLIICSPGVTGGRIDQPVVHTDIFPTVCDLLDFEKPPHLQGISLMPALKGKKLSQRTFYFESLYPYYSRGWAPLRGFIQRNEKYIDSPIPEFYDLESDFDELNNLVKDKRVEAYKKELNSIIEDLSNPTKIEQEKTIDKEALKKLSSLGYISNPNIPQKKDFGPGDDIKILLPSYNKANWTKLKYQEGEISLEMAIESFKEVITATEKIDIAYQGLASGYREMGRLSEAIEVLKTGFSNHPTSYEILRDLIQLLLYITP